MTAYRSAPTLLMYCVRLTVLKRPSAPGGQVGVRRVGEPVRVQNLAPEEFATAASRRPTRSASVSRRALESRSTVMRETIAVDRIDTSATLVSIHRISIARPLLVVFLRRWI